MMSPSAGRIWARVGRAEQRRDPAVLLLGKRGQVGVDHQPLHPWLVQGKALDADDQGVHLLPTRAGELRQFRQPRRLVTRHAAHRHIGNRSHAAARTAQRIDQFSVRHGRAAAVRPLSETGGQQLAFDQIGNGLRRLAFGPRSPLRQLDQFQVGGGLQPPAQFDLVLGTEQSLLKRRRKEHEHRILPAGGHDRPRVPEFGAGAQDAPAIADRQETLDDRSRRGHQVVIPVDHIVRPQAVVRRRQERHVAAADLHGLQRGPVGLFGVQRGVPLFGKIIAEQRVAGLKQHAHRRAFALEQIAADQGHVGDERRTEQVRQRRGLQGQLPLHPIARLVVETAQREHAFEVPAVLLLQLVEPEVVLKTSEPDVETLLRHVHGQRFDFDLLVRRRARERLPRNLGRNGQIGRFARTVARPCWSDEASPNAGFPRP